MRNRDDNSAVVVEAMDEGGKAVAVELNELVDITATADTSSVDVEVFVGSA